jgi:hypothetical protein
MKVRTIVLLGLTIILFNVKAICQDKDCKLEKFKDPFTGATTQSVSTPTRIGKLMVGKNGDRIVAFYTQKSLFLSVASNNTIPLRIDSIGFEFEDMQHVTIPAKGKGTAVNSVKLKPELETFEFTIEFPQKDMAAFSTIKIKSFTIYGEKEAYAIDRMNDAQATKFIKAFNCVK